MLKLTNSFKVFSFVKCFTRMIFPLMYIFKLHIHSFTKKKIQKKFTIMLRGVYNTGLNLLPFFQVTGNRVNYSYAFFLAGHKCRSHFFLSRLAFPKFHVKSVKRITVIDVFRQ